MSPVAVTTDGTINGHSHDNLSNDDGAFPNIPPFPSDVPTAPLLRLSLGKLVAGDEDEIDGFFEACKNVGFFYMDMRDCNLGKKLLEDVDQLFDLEARFFQELSLEEKLKYDMSSMKSYFGYKAMGSAILDKKGTPDRNEFYNISKDDILGISAPLPAPSLLEPYRPLLKSYITNSHSVVELLLQLLEGALHLTPGTLSELHRLRATSGDQVRFVCSPPQPKDDRRTALGEHTDFGSLTVLFNRMGGLQVQMPEQWPDETIRDKWVYVKPLPGHAIINLGDSMVKFTAGLLRSNIHRVHSPPGAQADCIRHSLVYFCRPEDDVILKRISGGDIPALPAGVEEEEINSKDWIIRRALGKRLGTYKGPEDWDRTMGTEGRRGEMIK